MGRFRKQWVATSIGLIAGATAVASAGLGLGLGASANATSTSRSAHVLRPHAPLRAGSRTTRSSATSYPVTAFHQEFATGTQYFCPASSGNAPCDGNGPAGDYGTIDRVASGFSNGGYGNYAPSTTALHDGFMALVSGTGDVNQGTGCPGTTPTSNPGEACTGPYALFGTGAAQGGENVFPSNGFTVTSDMYLSPSTSPQAGSLVDNDVELNNSNGTFGIDNVITACFENGTTPGYVINFGNNSPGSCSGTPVVTSNGWYRFVFDFSNVAGNAYVTESVYTEPGLSLVATSGSQPVGGTASSISNWGGPGYFWLPSQDMSGLPIANFALQLGQHPTGYTP